MKGPGPEGGEYDFIFGDVAPGKKMGKKIFNITVAQVHDGIALIDSAANDKLDNCLYIQYC